MNSREDIVARAERDGNFSHFVAVRLRQLWELRQMSRQKLARHSKTSRTQIWQIENRRMMPRLDTLERFWAGKISYSRDRMP